MGIWATWAAGAKLLKRDAIALYIAGRDPRTPMAAKLVVLAIAAYVVSPIDLIPDFIPVLGYLDELVLLPIAISFAIKMIPEAVMVDARAKAAIVSARGSRIAFIGAAMVVVLWVVAMWFVGRLLYSVFAA